MSEQIDTFARTLLAVVESSVRARLRAESAGRSVPSDVPAVVTLAAHIASLREELADAEKLLQRALRTSHRGEAWETVQDEEGGGESHGVAAQPETAAATETYRHRILHLLRAQPQSSWSVPSLVQALRASSSPSVRTCVKKMCARGELRRVSRGHYVLAPSRREKATLQRTPARRSRSSEWASSRTRTRSPTTLRARADESNATLRERILGVLGARPKGAATQEVASALRAKPGTVSATLAKLVASGRVRRMSRGWFALASEGDAPSKVSVPAVAPHTTPSVSVTARVVEALRKHHAGVDFHFTALAEELRLAPTVVRLTLGKLAAKNLVERRGDGVYRCGVVSESADDALQSAGSHGPEEIDAPEQLLEILDPVNITAKPMSADSGLAPAAEAFDPRRWVIRRQRPSVANTSPSP